MQTEAHEVTRRRFTVHEYHRMAEAGILHEDDRVELIDGELVEMTAIDTRHFTCVNWLTQLLVRNSGEDVIVSIQNPVRLNEYSEPQPDVASIRARDYRESLPTPRSPTSGARTVALRSGQHPGGLDRGPQGRENRTPHWPVRRPLPVRRTGPPGRDDRI